jgi:hypothetical protein
MRARVLGWNRLDQQEEMFVAREDHPSLHVSEELVVSIIDDELLSVYGFQVASGHFMGGSENYSIHTSQNVHEPLGSIVLGAQPQSMIEFTMIRSWAVKETSDVEFHQGSMGDQSNDS